MLLGLGNDVEVTVSLVKGGDKGGARLLRPIVGVGLVVDNGVDASLDGLVGLAGEEAGDVKDLLNLASKLIRVLDLTDYKLGAPVLVVCVALSSVLFVRVESGGVLGDRLLRGGGASKVAVNTNFLEDYILSVDLRSLQGDPIVRLVLLSLYPGAEVLNLGLYSLVAFVVLAISNTEIIPLEEELADDLVEKVEEVEGGRRIRGVGIGDSLT